MNRREFLKMVTGIGVALSVVPTILHSEDVPENIHTDDEGIQEDGNRPWLFSIRDPESGYQMQFEAANLSALQFGNRTVEVEIKARPTVRFNDILTFFAKKKMVHFELSDLPGDFSVEWDGMLNSIRFMDNKPTAVLNFSIYKSPDEDARHIYVSGKGYHQR